ncbi:MAG TPA: Hsp20 family protein [Alphaproteobacteria bacterium]|nr:Hsp20 family protein [Alphaproteobacteria bacterium]HXQ66451.1 Hsp20 family protein [Alphaproteobacteria bacterium]
MRTFDLSPLFRSTVGFDRMSQLLDSALRVDEAQLSYPPYNIEKTGEDSYRITMAVAGFGQDDISIVSQENSVTISGKAQEVPEGVEYLHRGIARRAFQRRFELADHIKVKGAELVNGLLHLDLVREVPEEQKPREIKISAAPKSVEAKAA